MYDYFSTWLLGVAIFEAAEPEPIEIANRGASRNFRFQTSSYKGIELVNTIQKKDNLVYDTPLFKSVDGNCIFTNGSIMRFNKGTPEEFSYFQYPVKFIVTRSEASGYNLQLKAEARKPNHDYVKPGYQHMFGSSFCSGSMEPHYRYLIQNFGEYAGNKMVIHNRLTDCNPNDSTYSNQVEFLIKGPIHPALEKYVVNDKTTTKRQRSTRNYMSNTEVEAYLKYVENPSLMLTDYNFTLTNQLYKLGEKKC